AGEEAAGEGGEGGGGRGQQQGGGEEHREEGAVAPFAAARAGAVHHLQPVCVAPLPYALLGEEPGLVGGARTALVLGGVALGSAR
ncbi:hypothetical protein AB0E72_26095, partial [Streptomyces filamentosus]